MAQYYCKSNIVHNKDLSKCWQVWLERLCDITVLENKPLSDELFDKIIQLGANMPVIYQFTRVTQTGEHLIYIGKTQNLQQRMRNHKTAPWLPAKRDQCIILYNAVRKYGWTAFTFKILYFGAEVINGASPFYLRIKEAEYISKLTPQYNADQPYLRGDDWISRALQGDSDKKFHTAETRLKIGKALGISVIMEDLDTGAISHAHSYRALANDNPFSEYTVRKYVNSNIIYHIPNSTRRVKFYTYTDNEGN
uniref:Orf250 n=1 Tax=Amoebidium parasiticum TaxID=4881 RepID=Q8M0C6_AMOPA|nr:Orf250 [Amoebidium parasiticum]